ncbi:MAG: winged helix-turn-helix domain-containing protein, partial [Verrucomicrobia bacterium]|nr:winged helix-turn-helix domain-containing protein [Verrucomicrobiota bacterium]
MNTGSPPANDAEQAPAAQAGSHSRGYIYSRIAAALRQDIREGKLSAGSRLPSADELTKRFKVNKGTVRRALADLAAEGLIYAVPAQGTYVSEDLPAGPRQRRRASLTVGLVSPVLEGAAFGPSDAEVLTGLQDELLKHKGPLMFLPAPRTLSTSRFAEWIVQAHLDGIIYLESL